MITTEYLPALSEKALRNEAPGGAPTRVSIVVPTITRPGKAFDIRISLWDDCGLPSLEAVGTMSLRIGAKGAPITVAFDKGRPAVATVKGAVLEGEGIFRVEAEWDGKACHSNPTLCTSKARENIYWGDPHIHTVLSQCHPTKCRSAHFGYTAARYVSGLDWAGCADHVSNGRCELARWKEEAAVGNLHDDPPHFVTLPAYEASLKGGAGGDNNVYLSAYPTMFEDDHDAGNIRTLSEKLAKRAQEEGFEFFVVPHHTSRTGKHGEIPDAIYPGSQVMPLAEIASKWGASEYPGNPAPLKTVHDGPAYIADMLDRGLVVGFMGGTDTHSTLTYARGIEPDHIDRLPGITAVLSGELKRSALFDSLKNRRCYAATGERIFLDCAIAGTEMGGMVSWADAARPRDIRATVAAETAITSIEVVRNRKVIRRVEPGTWQGKVDWTDGDDLASQWIDSPHIGRFAYYYLRVRCVSGATAWSSPVWLLNKTPGG